MKKTIMTIFHEIYYKIILPFAFQWVLTFKRVVTTPGDCVGIMGLCKDINYNQKQLYSPACIESTVYYMYTTPSGRKPLSSFLILCKLYYFHCLFTLFVPLNFSFSWICGQLYDLILIISIKLNRIIKFFNDYSV